MVARQRSGFASLLGPREVNEDSFELHDSSLEGDGVRALLAVADGMGGLRGGDVASKTAIDVVRIAATGAVGAAELVGALETADQRIRELAGGGGDDRSMGTTLTAALVTGQEAVVVHVGDTRAYVVHAGAINQITEDHSRVGRLVAEGLLTEEEAMHHPEQNVLERALGAGDPNGDVYRLGVGPGDVLFLCSDGLHTFVTADEICLELEHNVSLQAACERLARLAEDRGSQDNITAVAWEYPSPDQREVDPTSSPSQTIVRRRPGGDPQGQVATADSTPLWMLAGGIVASYLLGFGIGLLLAVIA
jgi:serine/threonine protein phosphatase PrpC